MADQVPFGVVQVAKSINLRSEFLNAILTEQPLSCVISLRMRCCGESLAHGHQGDVFGSASGTASGSIDPLAHAGEIIGNRHEEH